MIFTPFTLFKISESMNMQLFQKFNYWTQDVSYFNKKPILSVCVLVVQVSTSHLCYLHIGPQLASQFHTQPFIS